MVETFFKTLKFELVWRTAFETRADAAAAIGRYIAEHNDNPRPFTWTKPARDILRRVNRHAEPAE